MTELDKKNREDTIRILAMMEWGQWITLVRWGVKDLVKDPLVLWRIISDRVERVRSEAQDDGETEADTAHRILRCLGLRLTTDTKGTP